MDASLKPIICCGFTPCVQRVIEYAKFELDQLNCATRVTVGIGGKGANTARMVTQLGGGAVLVGFAGGANGRRVEAMLNDEGVSFHHVEVEGETRICQTLLEAGNSEITELVEEMPPISSNEWDQMIGLFQSLELLDSIVAVSGKLPAGAPIDAYAKITKMVEERGGRVILDATGESLLLTLEHRPFIVKINDVELLATFGGGNLMTACRELIQRGAQSVLITRGSQTSFYVNEFETFEISPPKIVAVNPVGSGDAVTAGLAVELSRGRAVLEAIITGTVCGSANALNLVVGLLKCDDVERLRCEVGVEKFSVPSPRC